MPFMHTRSGMGLDLEVNKIYRKNLQLLCSNLTFSSHLCCAYITIFFFPTARIEYYSMKCEGEIGSVCHALNELNSFFFS